MNGKAKGASGSFSFTYLIGGVRAAPGKGPQGASGARFRKILEFSATPCQQAAQY